METTVSVDGFEVRIRSLTWGEKEKLREEGIDLADLDETMMIKDMDALVSRVITPVVLDADVLADMDIISVYRLFYEVVQFSFLGENEAKNSDGPQP